MKVPLRRDGPAGPFINGDAVRETATARIRVNVLSPSRIVHTKFDTVDER